MDIAVIINGVISLFLIMILGIYGNRRGIITPEINKGLTSVLLEITLPCMIVTSFIFDLDDSIKSNIIKCFCYSPVVIIISIIISYIFLLPVKSNKKVIIQFSNVFSNCGFIGFPIIYSIYGGEGVIYASVFNMYFTIFLWTYGVMLYRGKLNLNDLKKVILNPGIIAVIIGVIIMAFNIKIPVVLNSTIELVGSMTSPLSMIIVGVILSRAKIMDYLKDWTIYYSSFIKLILIPLSLLLIAKIIKDLSIVSKSLIVFSAMPAATMTSILAENFNVEKEFSAVIVFITTLISLITFPVILKLIL